MIAVGCDRAGENLKNKVIGYLQKKDIPYEDFGFSEGQCLEYPEQGALIGKLVAEGKFEKGLVFCGTGIGISIAANKIKGIRAVVCSDCYSAKMSRLHNDANILALGERVIGQELAIMIVDIWLSTGFEGGRHAERLKRLKEIEER